jgi:hypothetical protein
MTVDLKERLGLLSTSGVLMAVRWIAPEKP